MNGFGIFAGVWEGKTYSESCLGIWYKGSFLRKTLFSISVPLMSTKHGSTRWRARQERNRGSLFPLSVLSLSFFFQCCLKSHACVKFVCLQKTDKESILFIFLSHVSSNATQVIVLIFLFVSLQEASIWSWQWYCPWPRGGATEDTKNYWDIEGCHRAVPTGHLGIQDSVSTIFNGSDHIAISNNENNCTNSNKNVDITYEH